MKQSVLLYDGLCGFCDGVVQFVMARDTRHTMQFAALQGAYAQALLQRHPVLRDVDSLMLVQPNADGTETVLVRSAAVAAIGTHLGGQWRVLAGVMLAVPRPIRDWGYDRVARVRFRIFGRRDACRIPSAEERARFLE